MTFIINIGYGQKNFNWDVVVDSLNKNRSELFSETKMFIAENAYSAQDIIQNNDPEYGVILTKGTFTVQTKYTVYVIEATYRCTITFYVKDNKVRIKLSDIYNSSSIYAGKTIQSLKPFDPNGEIPSGLIYGIPKKKAVEIMVKLQENIQKYVDDYIKYVSNDKINSGW